MGESKYRKSWNFRSKGEVYGWTENTLSSYRAHSHYIEEVRKPYILGLILTHFQPMFNFYTPWKHQKAVGFLKFSGGIKVEHWTKEGVMWRWDNGAICKAIIWFFLLIMFTPCYLGEIKFIFIVDKILFNSFMTEAYII